MTDEPKEPSDEIDFDDLRTATFSERPCFAGKPLEPFSPMRKRMFGEIRASCEAPSVGSQDALGADAARLLWLCSQSKHSLQGMMAGVGLPAPIGSASKPLRMQALIDDWADANGSHLSAKDDLGRVISIEIFASIWMQDEATRATPDNAGDADEGNGRGRKNRP